MNGFGPGSVRVRSGWSPEKYPMISVCGPGGPGGPGVFDLLRVRARMRAHVARAYAHRCAHCYFMEKTPDHPDRYE